MTHSNESLTQSIHRASMSKRMLQGALIALILIAVFLLTAGAPNPAWPKLWMLRPLIVVPLAGAGAGVFYYFMDHFRYQGGWKKILANVVCLIACIIALWLGTVLGLDGTWWD
jgi:hypothetical protein